MTVDVVSPHIEITAGVLGGKPRITGRRISVAQIKAWHLDQGMTVGQIAADYDLTQADVHAALTYYFDHREEIEERTSEEGLIVEEYRKTHESLLERKLKEQLGDS